MKNPLLLLIATLIFALVGLLAIIFGTPLEAGTNPDQCSRELLPEEFRHRLENEFSSWKIQERTNLSSRAQERWRDEKPMGCPGIAMGEFESATQTSFAVLLVPKDHPDAAYRLLVFTPNAAPRTDALKTIDQWDKAGAANNFIHEIQIAHVFSQEWIRKLRVRTKQGILAVDSGETEYGVEVYFGTAASTVTNRSTTEP